MKKHLRIVVVSLFFSLGIVVSYQSLVLSTMAVSVKSWKNPIVAAFTFPAGSQTDQDGNFEVEAYIEAHYDIEWISVKVSSTENITLEQEAPVFEGPLNDKERKIWRIKGKLTGETLDESLPLPEVVRLEIDYQFPDEAVRNYIETNHRPGSPDYAEAMWAFEVSKGEKRQIIKVVMIRKNWPTKSAR